MKCRGKRDTTRTWNIPRIVSRFHRYISWNIAESRFQKSNKSYSMLHEYYSIIQYRKGCKMCEKNNFVLLLLYNKCYFFIAGEELCKNWVLGFRKTPKARNSEMRFLKWKLGSESGDFIARIIFSGRTLWHNPNSYLYHSI